MENGTVVLRLIDLTWARLCELGCDEAALVRRVRRPRGAPWSRVPFETLCELVEAGAELTRDPHLGLRLSLPFDARKGGVLILLMLACRDVRAAARRLARYQRVAFDAHRVELEDDARRLVMDVPGPARPARPHLATWMCADALRGVRTMTGVAVRPTQVTLAAPAPEDSAGLARFFECPIVFDAPRTTLSIDEETACLPLRHANEVFRAALEEQAREIVATLPRRRTWRERARAAVEEELPREPTLAAVAARLRIPERTLQRRLHAEGTSVAELVAALRKELAARYLREGREVADVAHRLGYASPASFHRAFRVWYGTTPGAFRDRVE